MDEIEMNEAEDDYGDPVMDAIEGVGFAVSAMFDQFGGSADASADVMIDGQMVRVTVAVEVV